MTFKIEFQVVCETRYGEQAVICGNLPQLGSWNCRKGLDLLTDERSFPLWKSARPLFVRENTTVEFKLCIVTSSGQLVRWEQIYPNRIFTPRSSLIIHFTESEVGETFKIPRRKPSSIALGAQNVRKGTEDVINDLASDSSSNRQMWKQHRFNEQEESSLLLSQFADNLKKAVGTQREQIATPLQLQPEMQLQNQMEIGTFEHHFSKTHYIVTDLDIKHQHLRYDITEHEKIILLSSHNSLEFDIDQKEEVSVFHFFAIKNERQKEMIEQVKTRWAALTSSFQRGVLILYSADQNFQNFQFILDQQIDILVCCEPLTAKRIANEAKNQGYNLKSSGKNEFVVLDGEKFVLKVVLYGFSQSRFIEDIENNIKTLDCVLFKGFYFKYHEKDIRKQFRNALIQIHSARHECLIVMQIKRIEDLSVKTIADILELTSLKYDAVVIILAQERFPRNLHNKIPAIKNRLLILNTEGEIYSNGKESIDLFDYLEVTKAKFQQSQKIIAQKIGKGLLTKRNSGTLRMSLQFEDDAFGKMLKQRALRCIQDINKKSLAKVIPQHKNNTLELVPFALHSTFLLKVALATFTSRLRNDQKGLIISIESEGCCETSWMEPPQGRQINLQFCRFRLSDDKGKSYRCASLTETELNELLDVIAQLEDQKKKQGQGHQLIFDHAKSI